MEYKVGEFARLAGVSARTIRFYDSVGLLAPEYVSESGYRIYGAQQVKRLQQILLYREMGIELKEIPKLLESDSEIIEMLEGHLKVLTERRKMLDSLIENVKKSIEAEKGVYEMKDNERFDGFMKKIVDENNAKYGREMNEKYGEDTIAEANKKLMGMNEVEYKHMEDLEQSVKDALITAIKSGDVNDENARRLFELHRDWLKCTLSHYTKATHEGIALMYVGDDRFTKYYDDVVEGGAEYICAVIQANCN